VQCPASVQPGHNSAPAPLALAPFPTDRKLTMDQDLADENRLDVARRLYHAMCIQYPDRLIILVDPHGCLLACSDWPYEPSAQPSTP
jgi:hypothetical protein